MAVTTVAQFTEQLKRLKLVLGVPAVGKLHQLVRYGSSSSSYIKGKLRGNSGNLNYIVYGPGDDILFESSQGGYEFTGGLDRSGDHVVEVFYNGNQGTTGSYDIIFEIN